MVMDETLSFGYWIRRRRKTLDLTQEALAHRVGCSLGAIRKLEADERRPSRELAASLARVLEIPPAEHATFLQVARADIGVGRLAHPTEASVSIPTGAPLLLHRSSLPL